LDIVNALLAEAGDLAVDSLAEDHPVADLQAVEELLHLLLLALGGQQNDEIEDRDDEGERDELNPPRAAALRRRAEGDHPTERVHHD
jgi:hypothetical protein